jgi:regulator of replication initiation timing
VKSKLAVNHEELIQKNIELSDTITDLADELDALKAIIASKQWDATPFEQDYLLHEYKAQVKENQVLRIENQALRDSRDMFQNRNDELIRLNNTLKNKLHKQ